MNPTKARMLLISAALIAFGASLFAGFHLDDYSLLSDPALRSFGWRHPLTNLTFWLNYQVGGQEPWGYHMVNLLLHLGAVWLAYECLRRLLPPGAAVIAAVIFALHPLQAEAVNYVAMRGAMLVALFCLAALLAWLKRRKWLACLLILPVAAVAQIHLGGYALALVSLRFLRLLVLPWGFTIFPNVHEPLWLAVAAALAIAAAAGWWWRKGIVQSEVTWLLAGLLLLIPNFFLNPAVDSRMYLPMFAFAAAAGLLLARIPGRHTAIAVAVILGLLSAGRTYVWLSEERLWREAVQHAPDNAEPKIQLAKAVRATEALELLAQARQLAPYNPEIPAEAGKVLLDEQQFDSALNELSRAVALNPKNALAFNNRGVALAALGQIPAARTDFEHALVLDPALAEAQENLKRLGGQ